MKYLMTIKKTARQIWSWCQNWSFIGL